MDWLSINENKESFILVPLLVLSCLLFLTGGRVFHRRYMKSSVFGILDTSYHMVSEWDYSIAGFVWLVALPVVATYCTSYMRGTIHLLHRFNLLYDRNIINEFGFKMLIWCMYGVCSHFLEEFCHVHSLQACFICCILVMNEWGSWVKQGE
jgi:hypothetical protein